MSFLQGARIYNFFGLKQCLSKNLLKSHSVENVAQKFVFTDRAGAIGQVRQWTKRAMYNVPSYCPFAVALQMQIPRPNVLSDVQKKCPLFHLMSNNVGV